MKSLKTTSGLTHESEISEEHAGGIVHYVWFQKDSVIKQLYTASDQRKNLRS